MKILAMDYDGTLKIDGEVSAKDLAAIERWKKAGNVFVIDTGRSLESIQMEAKTWGFVPDYWITNNGGMVFDREGTVLSASVIDSVMSVDIMYIAHAVGNVVSYVVNDGIYRHRVIIDEKEADQRYPELEPDLTEEEVMQLPRHAQIVISMNSIEEARLLAERIRSHFPHLVEAYANKYVVDVVPYGISKAGGLDYLRNRLGVDVKDIYTLGDAENDIPLMEYGIHGACIRNSPEEVRSHAKILCDSAAELIDGIMAE